MASKNINTATAEETSASRTVKCRVVVNKLVLPHGIAARGKVVHIPEDVYKVHADAGKVCFIDYVRD